RSRQRPPSDTVSMEERPEPTASGRSFSGPGNRTAAAFTRPGSIDLADLHHQLAEVLPLQQTDEGFRRILQPLHYLLAILDLAVGVPSAHRLVELAVTMPVIIEDDEALHAHALLQDGLEQQRQAIRPVRQAGTVVLRDHTAHGYARIGIEQWQHRIEDLAADVLVIDVDALATLACQFLREARLAMVDAGIETQGLDGMAAFFLTTGDTYHMAALELADLAHGCANRPGGGGHYQGFAGLRLTDVQQPHVGSEARHPEHAQRMGRRFHVAGELEQTIAIGHRIVLPAIAAEHPVAWLVIRMTGFGDPAYGAADHHITDRHRWRVRWPFAHAATHIGIQRQIYSAQQQLPLFRPGHRHALQAEVIQRRCTVRPGSQMNLAILLRALRHDRSPRRANRKCQRTAARR